jgi:hypothetical protein
VRHALVALSALMLRILLIVALGLFVGGDVSAQSLQKLLDSAKSGAAAERAQPSATEQRNWASEKLSEFQAKEKALDLDMPRNNLREANPAGGACRGGSRRHAGDHSGLSSCHRYVDGGHRQGSATRKSRLIGTHHPA